MIQKYIDKVHNTYPVPTDKSSYEIMMVERQH